MGEKQKKPIFKRPWFIIIVVILVLGGIGSALGGGGESSSNNESNSSKEDVPSTSEVDVSDKEISEDIEEVEEIAYEEYTVDEMMEVLESNALKASTTYKDKYVQITGKLSTIDSSGKYISLLPANEEFAFVGVTCYIKNDDQLNQVAELSTDDIVTLTGKITDVGEVLGYSLDIDSIL